MLGFALGCIFCALVSIYVDYWPWLKHKFSADWIERNL